MNIEKIREKIDWFKKNEGLIYADSAATSLKPTNVTNAISKYYNEQSTNPHNSDSMFTNDALIKMQECRKLCGSLINASEDEIIFTSGATESLNLIAQSISFRLKKDDEIILTKFEHASNLLPWYYLRDKIGVKLVFAEIKNLKPTSKDFLDKITDKTKIISFTGMSNLIGLTFDVEEIANKIKNKYPKILLCVDIAQMIAHKKCDVKKWNVDFAAFSAHKIFGPTGIGVAYIKKELQFEINPIRFGGGMNFEINKDNFCYIDGVAKFEGGTPHVAGMYGWIEALKFINEIGYDFIEKYEKEIYEQLINGLNNNENIEIYNKECNSTILAFNVKGIFCQDLAAYLGKKGIIVRSGLSCAKLMDEVLETKGLVRASFYVYNSLEEIKRFIDILNNISKKDVLNELI